MKAFHELQSLGQLLHERCQTSASKAAYLIPKKGNVQQITYADHFNQVRKVATVLQGQGLEVGDRVCLFADNGYAWCVADWACHLMGLVCVPIYPTLPSDQAMYIVEDCGAKLVIVGDSDLEQRVSSFTGKVIQLKNGDESLMSLGDSAEPVDLAQAGGLHHVQRDDLATIIYTSGTTGNPKGAILTQDNFLFMMEEIKREVPLYESDTFLSFLPLSHVFERVNGHVLPVALGSTVGYVQSIATLAQDFLTIKPTAMLAVPRLLDALKSRIMDGVAKSPPFRQKLFKLALDQGTKKFDGQFAPLAGLTDKLVGQKIRERLGGRLRFFASGGAALPAHVAQFYGAFGIIILQGYGLTESTSGICINQPDDNDYRSLGMPFKGVEVKLASDGEILLRGRCIMKGYFNLPEATAEAIDGEGWFHTGDIGEWSGNKLKITDRKKDLLVLGNGKNVAPQPIEDMLKESPYIAEAVLFGDGMEYVCALIVPEFEKVKAYAQEQGINTHETESLMQLEAIRKLIKSEIDATNKRLADFQRVKKHAIITQSFSIEGGELTPSMKVKRKAVREKYSDTVQTLVRPS